MVAAHDGQGAGTVSRGGNRVIVTVVRFGEDRPRDLEVPCNLQAGELSALISRALKWDTAPLGQALTYRVEIGTTGETVGPDQSLAEAGAWDGTRLVFHPVRTVNPLLKAALPTPGPVKAWRPLVVPQIVPEARR